MTTRLKHRFVLTALIAVLGLMLSGPVTAQTLTNLHSFNGSDGHLPTAGLVLSGETLFGTTSYIGSGGAGTVFAICTNGTGFTNLFRFNGSDGSAPAATLVLSGDTLYGTTLYGGSSRQGTVFAICTNGTGFTNLHSFAALSSNNETNSDGANPQGGLVLFGNTLYGTAQYGGSAGIGTIFAICTNGMGFTNLYTFTNGMDGASPYAGLVLSGNTLYGTASRGGSSGLGTVFAINTDGTDFTNLHSLGGATGDGGPNKDGAGPAGVLVLSGNTLYGTAEDGGSSGFGTVFALNTNGTGFTVLHSFNPGSEGFGPLAGLTLSGATLYGTTPEGGSEGYGTVFAMNTNGMGFTTLYNFTDGSDEAEPLAGLILSGNTLYGTTSGDSLGGYGNPGPEGDGTVFALSLVPPLGIATAGNQVILSWPTWAPNLGLQSSPDLSSGSWSNVPTEITAVGTNYVSTNAITGPQQFFRLQPQ